MPKRSYQFLTELSLQNKPTELLKASVYKGLHTVLTKIDNKLQNKQEYH